VACGAGNNGGDGFCIARHLIELVPGVRVTVVTDASPEDMTPSTRANHDRLPSAVRRTRFDDLPGIDVVDVVVDALLGVGSTEQLRDPVPSHLRRLNALAARWRIAVDVPTGLNALTGARHPDMFIAHRVITIGAEKVGFHRGPCPWTTVVVPLSDGSRTIPIVSDVYRLDHSDIGRLLPQRSQVSSKFDHGRVLVIGGTLGMPGAPSLAAHAAIAVGAGLVDLAAPSIHPLTPREVMTTRLVADADGTIHPDEAQRLERMIARASCVVVGPGLGSNEHTVRMLATVLQDVVGHIPMVIDADGIRVLTYLRQRSPSIIVTPHMGELIRWQGANTLPEDEDRMVMARRVAAREGVTLHLKVVPAITATDHQTCLTVNGSPILGTAGSGDVLSGIIGGFLAQGLSALDATSLAAFVHAEAGRIFENSGRRSILSGELIPMVTRILAR
jgi:NAD(P)H-hydrate epimerase